MTVDLPPIRTKSTNRRREGLRIGIPVSVGAPAVRAPEKPYSLNFNEEHANAAYVRIQ